MFVSPAWAQEASEAAATTGGGLDFVGPLAPLILIFFVFYVMVLRPQNKRMVEHRRAIDSLQKGDKVVTGGGVVATVRKLHGDEEIELEIAPGIIVTALRSTLMSIRESAHGKSQHAAKHETETK
jgi:preprotein translocase subunit YajC